MLDFYEKQTTIKSHRSQNYLGIFFEVKTISFNDNYCIFTFYNASFGGFLWLLFGWFDLILCLWQVLEISVSGFLCLKKLYPHQLKFVY